MSDAIPLPPRPNLEHYRKQAKDLLKACKSTDPAAIREWATRWAESWANQWGETQAQLRGVSVSPALRAEINQIVDRIEQRLRLSGLVKLADAQFFLARAHGFESWPKFAKHVQALRSSASPEANFETAADAVVSGEIATLARLLKETPELIHQRSSRSHHSTLLHYVAANGVEDFRQKTPTNAIDVAKLLLDAGADVNAESDAYGGGSTTLGLVATSVHPLRAGVQIALMELLLDHGANLERTPGAAVNACLANGRREAAEYFAAHGAHLDLEGAAGVGRLDVVESFFREDGTLKPNATKRQMERGFLWACEFGWNEVVEFLLDRGVDPRVANDNGMTGLHWAAHGGQLDTVKLLLARDAPLEATNVYGGTVLGQAVWSAINDPQPDHVRIIEALVDAGARAGDDWFTDRPQIDEALRRGRLSGPA